MQTIIAGLLGLLLGPVGLWYKGRWAAGFAWIFIGTPIAWVLIAKNGIGILPLVWVAIALHAMIAEPQSKRNARAIAQAIAENN